jgi:hypothetical protein
MADMTDITSKSSFAQKLVPRFAGINFGERRDGGANISVSRSIIDSVGRFGHSWGDC